MEACLNHNILKVIYFATLIIDIVKILIPIGIIVIGMIDLSKSVIAHNEDEASKNLKLLIKRIIYGILIFVIPTVVKIFMIEIGNLTSEVNFTDCLEKANPTDIKLLEEEAEKNKDKLKDNNNNDNNNDQTGKFKHISNGTKGKYFAPIQGVKNYRILSAGSTPGCSGGNIYHDLADVDKGTPIYAGMDGVASFMQAYITSGSQKDRLYSYGNHIKIKSDDGKVTILYAHLNKFAEVVEMPKRDTCTKKQDGSLPCSATVYSGTTAVIGTYKVKAGDLIGYLGDTGNSVVPHLHVEIKDSNGCINDPFKEFGLSH